MREIQTHLELPGVPQAKQGREVAPRWAWTEASVWTERMLATLERGIKGGKWFSLIDKVWKMENLESAVKKVAHGKSEKMADGKRCRRYAETCHRRLPGLQEKLKKGEYQPAPARRIWIPKMGSNELRPLSIPPVENRVVEMALRNVIEPIFENEFAEHSYGFRPQRGAKDALRRVVHLLQKGKVWVVDADIKGYLDPYSYYTLIAGGSSKSCGWFSKTWMRKPFCFPRLTWTTSSSPRFTRCMMVCRDTPRMRMAWNTVT